MWYSYLSEGEWIDGWYVLVLGEVWVVVGVCLVIFVLV